MTTCHTCHAELADYKELALHISTTKGHRKGKKWAANFLMKVNERPEIKKIAVNPDYEPTEFGDENRANAKRELSGDQEYAGTVCPNCRRISRELLPVEFVHSNTAWRIGDKLAVNCGNCRRRE